MSNLKKVITYKIRKEIFTPVMGKRELNKSNKLYPGDIIEVQVNDFYEKMGDINVLNVELTKDEKIFTDKLFYLYRKKLKKDGYDYKLKDLY